MKGWILYKQTTVDLKPEMYEINRFVEEAEKMDIEIDVLSPDQIDLMVTREDRKSILVDGQISPLPDFVLPRMGAGTTYFALAVIRHLERLGVPCFNTSAATEIVKDKLFSQQILAEKNLPVPKTMLVKFPVNEDLVEKFIGFPVVIKTLSGSQGKGVFLSDNKKSFVDLMHLIEATNSAFNVILQEFIEDSYGKDLRVFTIGGRAIACMERNAVEDGFKANFSSGGSVGSYEITPEIAWLATEAARISGLDIAGVDLLFDGDHFKICEVNSSPGFEGLESCCNVNIPLEVFNYLRIRMGHFK
ncbi:gamma-F420-2:alpha-L-glutamate ligase [Desulfonispora thiosulfatigenes DSM 11270]|uniref:Gamma-F420-2:alpha-L-glutamate ligase n=1 Tax=Desulfonispora thiosulfatigenes DSM 11270 TaxID=656914 RepID=A0A1W1UJ99_DESTI|nr:RimK family alpha-L-glutamate ligase [Desulfonispora thiosulfatigenes]SMB81157.1 gamma-F420-2:alpha-L-glutamate ligase [Desulfonispora thiosulfatigenes DSM 11270]